MAPVTVTGLETPAIGPRPLQSSSPFVLVVHAVPQVLAFQETQ